MLSGMLLIIAFIPTPHDNKLTLEGDMQIKDWKKRNTSFQTQKQKVFFTKQTHLIT